MSGALHGAVEDRRRPSAPGCQPTASAVPASQSGIPDAERRREIGALFGGVCWAMPTGSRVICNPPPLDTDEDWLVYCSADPAPTMLAAGFTQDGSPEFYTGNDAGGFRSWRRDNLNIVTTQDLDFYYRFETATLLAKRFNLLAKADRIALFQAVLYAVRAGNLEAVQ